MPHCHNADYYNKWPKAFTVPDIKADQIVKLFVEEIVCRHGAPERLLPVRGKNFLSQLMKEVIAVLKCKKVYTTAIIP